MEESAEEGNATEAEVVEGVEEAKESKERVGGEGDSVVTKASHNEETQ